MPKINIRIRKSNTSVPGMAPGTMNIPGDAPRPRIFSFRYNADEFAETEISTLADLAAQVEKYPGQIHWFDIHGFGDRKFFEDLGSHFGFHRLEMEDIFNLYQRPKVEEYADHLFFISRIFSEIDGALINDQLSMFLKKNIVITIQENFNCTFENIRERIRKAKGYLRHQAADYLAYAITDSSIDLFFPLLEKTGDRLDALEDELITNPQRSSLNKILQIKRELIVLRRAIFQERDKINDVLRSNFSLISESTRVYFRDAYDHCIQILDIADSYREVTSSMMDVYMSSVSNRLNQVMKVLTIISTIFIPLTFIVGIYGMNFSYTNPVTGEVMPLNMPELYSPYGYVGIMLLMLLIVLFQVYFFYKRGWLQFRKTDY